MTPHWALAGFQCMWAATAGSGLVCFAVRACLCLPAWQCGPQCVHASAGPSVRASCFFPLGPLGPEGKNALAVRPGARDVNAIYIIRASRVGRMRWRWDGDRKMAQPRPLLGVGGLAASVTRRALARARPPPPALRPRSAAPAPPARPPRRPPPLPPAPPAPRAPAHPRVALPPHPAPPPTSPPPPTADRGSRMPRLKSPPLPPA